MASFTVISWNTTGPNSPIKRPLLFKFFRSYDPLICIFQETHLLGSKTLQSKKALYGIPLPIQLFLFARGVSILVWKSLPFCFLHLELDPDRRYIVIYAMIECLELVLVVGLYIPPPASLHILHRITATFANFSTDNIIIMGDFNMPLDPELARLATVSGALSQLSAWAEAYGFTDVWRWKYPYTREYTCYSATYKSFSRNDLAYVRGPLFPKIQQVSILPRGISDHESASESLVWDVFKAFSRGHLSRAEADASSMERQ